jgi:hypothetical protein
MIRSAQLPVLRAGRRVLIPRQAFIEWIKAQSEWPGLGAGARDEYHDHS